MSGGNIDTREFAAFAATLADASGPVLRRYFRQPYTVESKADASPVTIADRESEQALRAAIETRYPTQDRKSTRLNSSHSQQSRMPSSA